MSTFWEGAILVAIIGLVFLPVCLDWLLFWLLGVGQSYPPVNGWSPRQMRRMGFERVELSSGGTGWQRKAKR